MTAATATRTGATAVTFGRVLRSEWIKFTSLRSTYWSSAVIVALWLGLALLLAATAEGAGGAVVPDEVRQYVTVNGATIGVNAGVLVAGVLGVLIISGEYATGSIRSSLAAVPRRLPVLAAKGVVVFVWTFLLGAVSIVGAYLVGLPFYSALDLAAPLGAAELLAFLGGAVYLGAVALLGLGIGAAVRSSAGGIAITLGLVLVLPLVASLVALSVGWVEEALPYLVSNAGQAMTALQDNALAGAPTLTAGVATAVVVTWSAIALAIGALVLKGRDA